MDQHVTLAAPLDAVFARLADPTRLGEWLPDLSRVEVDQDRLMGIGLAFAVTTHATGDQRFAAEVVAHEPPWLVAYRLLIAEPLVIRLACTAHGDSTRVHIHQTDAARPLGVDLAPLCQGLSQDLQAGEPVPQGAPAIGTGGPDRRS